MQYIRTIVHSIFVRSHTVVGWGLHSAENGIESNYFITNFRARVHLRQRLTRVSCRRGERLSTDSAVERWLLLLLLRWQRQSCSDARLDGRRRNGQKAVTADHAASRPAAVYRLDGSSHASVTLS